jgi:hypothetical protein
MLAIALTALSIMCVSYAETPIEETFVQSLPHGPTGLPHGPTGLPHGVSGVPRDELEALLNHAVALTTSISGGGKGELSAVLKKTYAAMRRRYVRFVDAKVAVACGALAVNAIAWA